MSIGMAAVQARIAQIEGTFGPRAGTAVAAPAAAAPTSSFSSALSLQQASLSGALPAGLPTAVAVTASGTGTASRTGTAGGTGASGTTGQRVVDLARQHLGTPYVWGGEAPGGFDCSGLVQWSYAQVGIDLPRVSRDQAKAGRAVSPADARPGDLVFFERGAVDHIGLYAGEGKWVVAPRTGDVVKVQDVDLGKATTIRRVLPDGPATSGVGSVGGGAASGSPAAGLSAGAARYAGLFAASGARHGVSPALLTAVARAESGFDAGARSSAGAQGLMQLMPATAQALGVDAWKPAEAVDGAARLLKQHLQRFGSTELALAAYNAGPGAVSQHGGVPPYAETRAYVAKVMSELRGGSA